MPDWILQFPESISLNIKDIIDQFITYITVNWKAFFDTMTAGLRVLLLYVNKIVSTIPWWLLIALVFILTFRICKKLTKAVLYSLMLFFIGSMGLWDYMNMTISIVLTSVVLSLLIGFPLGVLISASKHADSVVRPFLDMMQTMPAFVYLIPAVMLLGLGNVPAVIATTIYALPPIIRLTNHGIKQVDAEVIEAAEAFGSTKWQMLIKVQIPQALPTIMTGLNQTIMMALSMVVTCSMIGASGLGSEVIIAINRLEIGRGFSAGISVVILAVILDRITQGIYKQEDGEAGGKRKGYFKGRKISQTLRSK